MNDDIVKQAANFIPGGSSLSQDEREAAARAILALYPSRDIAVSVVDAVHGYTCEFSSDPAYHASQYDMAETVISDALGKEPVGFLIGDQTMERVFKAAGLTNLSDLQAVMDAVERALTVKPLEWAEHPLEAIARTKFAHYTVTGNKLDIWKVGSTASVSMAYDDEAQARKAAQEHHNSEVGKYLQG